MSKSNLKNINKLNTTRHPDLIYPYKTYANILLKLQKSILWTSTPNNLIIRNILNYSHNFNIILTFDINWVWSTYILYKNNFTKYSPRLISGKNSVFEVSTIQDYKYIDVDILEYLKKLEREFYKKIKSLKF